MTAPGQKAGLETPTVRAVTEPGQRAGAETPTVRAVTAAGQEAGDETRAAGATPTPGGASGDPAADAGYRAPPPRVGFFTDTSICIGCKACEVACKEWNDVPVDGLDLTGMSYDNTGGLGASTWRHVAFVEQQVAAPGGDGTGVRWLMSSDVCKHCTSAACLDVCPTGSLLRTELGTVVVQDDVCNGCGYCIPACPYGVIDQRQRPRPTANRSRKGPSRGGEEHDALPGPTDGSSRTDAADPNVGLAQKCTLCYDRIGAGLQPACASACPTDSIQFGPLDDLRARAVRRVDALHAAGVADARLYGEDPGDGVGGAGSLFLLLDDPEVYGLPPDPVCTTRDLPAMWRRAGLAAAAMAAAAALASLGRRP